VEFKQQLRWFAREVMPAFGVDRQALPRTMRSFA